jgi:RNA polymerase sigma-70 factor (ECF subfamily)
VTTPPAAGLGAEIDRIVRAEHGRVVASLTRRFGDLDVAEEAVGEALLLAAERWPSEGLPPNPGGWLTTVAGNKALDRIRRENVGKTKYTEAAMLKDDDPPPDTGPIADDRLRLVFTCCHPALAPENRVALTLRLLGGLSVAQIAHAFFVSETTMAQRLTRSKAKIKAARIPYRVPRAEDLPERLSTVLAVLYLIFNEAYLPSQPSSSLDTDLADEAIRLTRQVVELVPAQIGPRPEVDGLLALMLLSEARRPARFADGVLVVLPDQDRTLWDSALVDEGHRLVRACLARNEPGPYQLLAAINAVHTDALDASMTDWHQIGALYDQLYAIAPTPMVALNRAVAVAELDGPEVALAQVDRVALSSYHAWHATRADLLRRLGRNAGAREAYAAAIELAGNEPERAWLERRRGDLPDAR